MFLKIKKELSAFIVFAFTAAVCLFAALGLTLGGSAAKRVWAEGEMPEGAFAMLEFDGDETKYYVASDEVDLSTVFEAANAKTTTENSPAKITLLAETSAKTLRVESGKFITLDLNGISLWHTGDGAAVEVSGTFTLEGEADSSYIRGGQNGCVYVNKDGTFIMNSGNFAGNVSKTNGGGVYVSEGGTFIMNGGYISANTAEYNGGGVYNAGTFTMNGGTIAHNDAKNGNGGGVYNVGKFNISGSINISANQTTSKGSPSNVYFEEDGEFAVVGALIESNIVISNLGTVSGYAEYNKDTKPSAYFKTDEGKYCVQLVGNEVKFTEQHSFNSEGFCKFCDVKLHEITSIVITSQPTKTTGYKAFDKFEPEGMTVKTHCGICNQDIGTVTDYTVEYAKGNYFHAGDTSVTVVYMQDDIKLTASVTVAAVEKLSVAVSWQYAENANKPVWGDWKSEFNYRPALQDLKSNVHAVFTGGDGKELEYRGSSNLVILLKDGEKQGSIKDAGDYTLSLNESAPEFADYSFTGNSATLTVKPMSIDLSDADNFYWLTQNDATLLSGYIEDYFDGEYKYYSVSDKGGEYVERSVVRNRNKVMTIHLFGAHSTENSDNGAYDIEYGEGCSAMVSGRYTANATLRLVNGNYVFKNTDNFPENRQMTATVNEDGSVTVTKVWYIAQVDNGLLSQHGENYGEDWEIDDWIYGDYKTQYAPRLEHGDPGEYQSTKTFAADDNLVTFELYRIESDEDVDRVLIGERFNRYAFADYINASIPAGSYVLVVYVDGYTSIEHVHWYDGTQHDGQAAGVFYDAFESEFNFKVSRATFTQTNIDSLENKTFTFTYDGKVHLYDETFKLNAPVKIDRAGEWAKANYDSYFGNAELTYNLTRWDTGAYLTADGVASYNNEWQKPQGVDTYTVRYKLTAPNYRDLGGDKFFTVVVNKADYDMSGVTYGNLETTYDGTVKRVTVNGLPEGVTYRVDGRINAGTHKLTVTFTGDTANYNEIPNGSVTLIINKAHVAVPETFTATLDGDSYTYVSDSSLYEVVGNATFTQAGKYDITLSLKDAANYTWQTADGEISDTTVKVKLDLKPKTPAPTTDNGTVDVWLLLDIIMGVVIAGEIVYPVYRLLRKNNNTEGAE